MRVYRCRCGRDVPSDMRVGWGWWQRCLACTEPHIGVLWDSQQARPTNPAERTIILANVARALKKTNMFFALWPETAMNGARNHVRPFWQGGDDLDMT